MWRAAVRSLRSTSVVAALFVLALAMSATTVTLSVVDTVVLRQLPFDKSEELAALVTSPQAPTLWQPVSGPEVVAWQKASLTSLDSLAAVAAGSEVLRIGDQRVRVISARVTPNLFEVLRSRPAAGRLFTSDDQPHDASAVVISHELWQRMFAEDPNAIGTVLTLSEGPATIVGVLAPNGGYPIATTADTRTDVWTLLDLPNEGPYLRLVARTRPGATLSAAAAELRAATREMIQVDLIKYQRWTPTFLPLYEVVVGPVRPWMLLLLAGVATLLVLACVNMANVLFIRSATRSKEIAIRAVLGATRQKLAFMLFREGALLALVATATAILTAPWGIAVARAALPRGIARTGSIELDTRILLVTLGVGLATTLLCALAPVLRVSRSDLSITLRARDSGATGQGSWRSAFLVAEISLVTVLTVATALFVGSLVSAMRTDLGFDRSGLVEVTPGPLTVRPEDAAQRLLHVPGVESAALVNGSGYLLDQMVGRGADTGGVILATLDSMSGIMVDPRQVSSGFFSTARITLVGGTTFGDDVAARATIVIDEAAARQLFGDQDPIGQQLRLADSRDALTVVGVSRQVKREGPDVLPRRPTVYQPIAAVAPAGSPRFLLRLSRPPSDVSSSIQATVAAMTRSLRPADVAPVEVAFERFTARRRFAASLMGLVGSLALLVGTAGVYAAMSTLLGQQLHEFGVRAALGETPGQLGRRIVRKAVAHLLVGLGLGLPLAWGLTKGWGAVFFGVHPNDPVVYLIVAGFMLLAGVLACIPVARRATQVDPIRTLRAG